MAAIFIVILIGILIARELVQAYSGPKGLPAQFRWIHWGIFLLLLAFCLILVNRIVEVFQSL